jgi:poly-gamma-glutamate capsule biosynthesis protein CapA/YwtB (metallophosphatase superfamily)
MTKKRKRRKLKKGFKIFLVIFSITLISIIGYIIIKPNKDNKTISKPNILNKNEDKHYEASLIAVGDYLIHSSVYKDANRLANGDGYDFKPMISYIKEIVSNYDIAYYNQETILGGSELGLSDYPTFNSPYEAGDAMLDAGFNLVSLATNHTMDSGKKAVENSCKYWQSKENVLTAGSYCSEEERNKINIKEINNIKYTMLNYTYGTNGMPVANDYLVNVWPTDIDNINNPEKDTKYQAYKKQVKEDIDKVKDKVDFLIVAMHWGVEYTHEPTAYEKDMASYLASLGVNLIIGTHPHVIQPVTWIDDTLVIYSLGNFISAQYQNKNTCTNYKCTTELMTSLKIEKDIKNNQTSVKITNVENELLYNYYNQSTWRNFKVIPFSNPKIKEYLPNYKEVYNTYKAVVQKMDNEITVKDAAE